MKVVIIGNGGQSRKIQKILKEKEYYDVYKPKNKLSLDSNFGIRLKNLFFL